MQYPDLIHFHSSETKVSLELPVGWEFEAEGDGQATYVCNDAVDAAVTPKLIVKTIAVPPDPEAWRGLADQLTRGSGRDVLRSEVTAVDGVPARVDVVEFDEPTIGHRLVQLQAVAQISDVIFVLTGVAAEADRKEMVPVFDQAVRSVRFILA